MINKQLAKKFPYIVAWGHMMGSMDYYIDNQLLSAEASGAPEDAIYVKNKDADTGIGKWATLDGVVNPDTTEFLLADAAKVIAKG